mmetsp:Transcript_35667/g.40515  ORF Transcript_35667/g.40515 Transcript_35667/m.40515 type:complete len:84 (-) Transcript_35667:440-691(-)
MILSYLLRTVRMKNDDPLGSDYRIFVHGPFYTIFEPSILPNFTLQALGWSRVMMNVLLFTLGSEKGQEANTHERSGTRNSLFS